MSDDTSATEPTVPPTAPTAGSEGSGVRVPRWSIPVLAVLVVGLAVAVFVLAATIEDEDGSTQREVAAVAAEVAMKVFSFDHGDLERDRERLTELLTGRMEAEYLAAFEGPLAEQLRATESVGEATVKEVFVGDVGADDASVVAVLDLRVRTATGERTTLDSYVLLRLVRSAAGWRVDDVVTVNGGLTPEEVLDGGSGAPTAGSTTTSMPLG